MKKFPSLFKMIMFGTAAKRFFLGAVLSFSFSIAVILSTAGLMDGFESTLREGLKNSTGDLVLYNKDTFFNASKALELIPEDFKTSAIIEVEAFVISQEMSRGVLVKGVSPKAFKEVTSLELNVSEDEIVIGNELAKSLGLKSGDEVVLALSTLRGSDIEAPELISVKVAQIIQHGIYEKDLRFIYVDDHFLRKILNVSGTTSNRVLIALPDNSPLDIDKVAAELNATFPAGFIVEPYWKEFDVLLQAVGVEKFSITLILQLIVVVAVFNVLAFIFFITEKKNQDFFLLRALGLSFKNLASFWIITVVLIWMISIFVSYLLTKFFDYLLQNLSVLQIPGDIYVLSSLKLDLSSEDYLLVYSISLIWILLLCCFGIMRLRKKSILSGLRQEFQ